MYTFRWLQEMPSSVSSEPGSEHGGSGSGHGGSGSDSDVRSVPEKKTTKNIWTWAGKHACCFGSQLWLQMIYAHNFSRSSSYYV